MPVSNFIEQLYALPSRNDQDQSISESDDGTIVTRGQDEEFFYNIDRKVKGIEELHELLAEKDLELKVVSINKTENGKSTQYPRLIVQKKGELDLLADLSAEDRTQVDTLIATCLMGINLARAIVKKDDLNIARELDKRAELQAIDDAARDDEEQQEQKRIEALTIEYLQSQLDAVFESAVAFNSVLAPIQGIIEKCSKQEELKSDEEKILFAFIRHTYGSFESYVEDVPVEGYLYFNHELLKDLDKEWLKKVYYKTETCPLEVEEDSETKGVIERLKTKGEKISLNEKLALIRSIRAQNIDISKLNDEVYTSGLEGPAKDFFAKIQGININSLAIIAAEADKVKDVEITSDDVKYYAEVLCFRKNLNDIAQHTEIESALTIIDGQDQLFNSRLRSALTKAEAAYSKTTMDFFWKHGLESTTQIIDGFDIKTLNAEVAQNASEAVLETGNFGGVSSPKPFLIKRKYNSELMLEEGHVSAITKHLLKRLEVPNIEVCIVHLNAQNNPNAKRLAERNKQNALLQVAQGKPVALQIANGGHWITVCLLPEKDSKKVTVVSMDSTGDCGLGTNLVESKDPVDMGLKVLGSKMNLEISDLHNLSVVDQQKGNCCGFATAVNAAAIMKTYNGLNRELPKTEDGGFDEKAFRQSLLPNVFYRQEDGKTKLYGNKESNLTMCDFVQQFGGLVLQEVASKESKQKHLSKAIIIKLKKLEADADGSLKHNIAGELQETDLICEKGILEGVLKGKQSKNADAALTAGEIRVLYGKKYYDISQEEYQRITNVEYWQGLEAVLNGGALDKVLSTERGKNLFKKILQDAFTNGKNPRTKEFIEMRDQLKGIVHIDDEVMQKLREVIEDAKKDEAIPCEISTWDAIMLFLYNLPLIGNIVEWFGCEVVTVAKEVNELESKCTSWKKYMDSGIAAAAKDLILPAVAA